MLVGMKEKGVPLTSSEIREAVRARVRPRDWSRRVVTYRSIARETRLNVLTVVRFVRDGKDVHGPTLDLFVWWLRRHPLEPVDND